MMNIFRSIVGYVRRHRVLSVIGAIVTILLLTGIYFLFKPKPPQYVTASVTRGNLTQVVEAAEGVGRVQRALNARGGEFAQLLADEPDGLVALALESRNLIRLGARRAGESFGGFDCLQHVGLSCRTVRRMFVSILEYSHLSTWSAYGIVRA
jgi:hypothetical protein